ncbi:unnamed protein product, partial [marine sediment metagenome]
HYDRHHVVSEALMIESIRQKGIVLADLPDQSPEGILAELHRQAVMGVVEIVRRVPSAEEFRRTVRHRERALALNRQLSTAEVAKRCAANIERDRDSEEA